MWSRRFGHLAGILAICSVLTILVRAAVGPSPGGDGTYNLTSARVDKTGALVTTGYGGDYGEASLRQLTFAASDPGTGVAPPTTLSTVAILSLYNPSGNNQRFRVQKVSIGYVSGTLSSGTIYHAAIISTAQAAPSGGALIVNVCMDIGSGATGTGVVRIGPTVAAGVRALRPFVTIAPSLATSVFAPDTINEDLKGEVVVEPGASYQLQSVMAGAGTSPLITAGVSWTEEPIK